MLNFFLPLFPIASFAFLIWLIFFSLRRKLISKCKNEVVAFTWMNLLIHIFPLFFFIFWHFLANVKRLNTFYILHNFQSEKIREIFIAWPTIDLRILDAFVWTHWASALVENRIAIMLQLTKVLCSVDWRKIDNLPRIDSVESARLYLNHAT